MRSGGRHHPGRRHARRTSEPGPALKTDPGAGILVGTNVKIWRGNQEGEVRRGGILRSRGPISAKILTSVPPGGVGWARDSANFREASWGSLARSTSTPKAGRRG